MSFNLRDARETFLGYGAVALGSMIGSVARAAVGMAIGALGDAAFPWATLLVNVTGSFMIGYYAAAIRADAPPDGGLRRRQFVMAGICGGYTTFSAFSLETLRLIEAGNGAAAGINVGFSIAGWLAAVWLGHRLGMRVGRAPLP